MKKVFKLLLVFAASFVIFNALEFDLLSQGLKYMQSLIFSLTLAVLVSYSNFRDKLIYIALIFVMLSAALYFVNQLALSNSSAAIGIGMLLIIALSKLPQIIKNEI